MMDFEVSKDTYISRWVDSENLIYVKLNSIKNCAQRKRRCFVEQKKIKANLKLKQESSERIPTYCKTKYMSDRTFSNERTITPD